MREQWRLRIRAQRRKQIDVNLLIQAAIALAEQLASKEREREQGTSDDHATPPCKPQEDDS